MSRKKKEKAQHQAPSEEDKVRQYRLALARLGVIKILGMTFLIGLSVVGFGYVTFYLPIQASHGEATTITVAQNWLANVNASVYIAWGAAAAVGLGTREVRRRWLKERKEKDARIAQLERQLDPNRTSSRLTPEGRIQS